MDISGPKVRCLLEQLQDTTCCTWIFLIVVTGNEIYTVALLLSVKWQVFCVGDRLKVTKLKAWGLGNLDCHE